MNITVETIEERLQRAYQRYWIAMDEVVAKNLDYHNMTIYLKPYNHDIERLKHELCVIKEPQWRNVQLEDYEHLVTIDQWVNDITKNCLTDYDGFGYYATRYQITNIVVKPSHLGRGWLREDFTHVLKRIS